MRRQFEENVHYMNKDEKKMLRSIQSKTGLDETQIREIKKYRKMLSDAQKKGQKAKLTPYQKAKRDVFSVVCKKLKLPKEHPITIDAAKKEWERRKKSLYYPIEYWMGF